MLNFFLLSLAFIPLTSFCMEPQGSSAQTYHVSLSDIDEAKYLIHLEQRINSFINTLNPELQRELSDWGQKFACFKKKLELIKPYIINLVEVGSCKSGGLKDTFEGNIPCYSTYSFKGMEFLYTLLGLKPITIDDYTKKILLTLDIQEYIPFKLIDEAFPNTIFMEKIHEDTDPDNLYPVSIFALCIKPLFPLSFIYKNYELSISIGSEFKHSFLTQRLNMRKVKLWLSKFLDTTLSERSLLRNNITEDEKALMFGLQPVWFSQASGNFIEKTNFAQNKHNYRYLLLPGVVCLKDNCPYIQLYSMVMEYLWIHLVGMGEYLSELGKHIKSQKSDLHYTLDLFNELQSLAHFV